MATTHEKTPANTRREHGKDLKREVRDPSAPEKPSHEKMKAQCEKLDHRIKDLKQQQRLLQESRKDKDVGAGVKEERTQLQRLLQDLRKDLGEKVQERQAKQARIREIDDEKKQLRNSIGKEVAGFESVAEVEHEIKRLEYILETSSVSSLKKEKKMMERIRELEHNKHIVKERETRIGELSKRDSERESLLEEVKSLQNEIEGLRTKLDQQRAQLDALHAKSEASEAQSAYRLESQRLSNEIQQCHKEISNTKQEFQKALQEYFDWEAQNRERKQKERDEREKQRTERMKKFQEERRQRDDDQRKAKREEERIRRLNPKEDEIDTCNQLIAYLLALEGQQSRQQESQTVEFDPAQATVRPGLVPLKRDGDDDWLFQDRTKKKERTAKKSEPQAAEKKDKRLHLHMVKVQGFSQVGVTAPQFLSQIDDTIAKLKEKKAFFETFRKTQAEVDAELAAEDAAAETEKAVANEEE